MFFLGPTFTLDLRPLYSDEIPEIDGDFHREKSDVKEKDLGNLWAVLGQVDFGVEV